MTDKAFIDKVRHAGNKRLIYTSHALDEMNAENEMIRVDEVREVVAEGEVIEDYPNDKRGHSCLISGRTSFGRTIHVVCSPGDGFLWIITVYLPDAEKWTGDFKTRKRRQDQ